jgi:hypothetical protein
VGTNEFIEVCADGDIMLVALIASLESTDGARGSRVRNSAFG